MPTYTILGATGKTGGALLDLLLQKKDPSIHLNAYARSKTKLLAQKPSLQDHKNVSIFEGSLSDIPLIASTLSNQKPSAAFCVLGMNENMPGIRIAQDMANTVVAALCHARNQDSDFKPPKLIFLSSASLSTAAHQEDEPAAAKAIITRAMSHAYADLRFAEENLLLHQSWLDVTFVRPPALTEDVQKGHELSVEKIASGFLSYLDLAAGMIEIAESGGGKERYKGMGVSVIPTGKDVRFEPNAPPQILRGLVWHFAPWMYWTCRALRIVS
ncbi:MAG: hypothetical protein L6R41_001756 [Letrouitia leprolyta]|nr:MAG: hypothetical protein L6R41_001756 [Letrouitia leprolyta]